MDIQWGDENSLYRMVLERKARNFNNNIAKGLTNKQNNPICEILEVTISIWTIPWGDEYSIQRVHLHQKPVGEIYFV